MTSVELGLKSVSLLAQALSADATARVMTSLCSPELELGTCVQVVPFQCSISVLASLPLPNAQALSAETAVTPSSSPITGPRPGACVQVVPFYRRISVLTQMLLVYHPTV